MKKPRSILGYTRKDPPLLTQSDVDLSKIKRRNGTVLNVEFDASVRLAEAMKKRKKKK